MNFDDKGNDYFLHDFKAGNADTSNTGNNGNGTSGQDTPGFTFPEAERNGTGQGVSAQAQQPVKRKKRHRWFWFFFILLVIFGVFFYIRYCSPYVVESRTAGFVTRVEKKGYIFKTYEGEMISQEQLTDTTRIYSRDFLFSIPNDSLARVIQSYQGTGRPVTIICNRYLGTLPWRGESNTIAVAVEP
ncbi:MAG: hypothetical protein K2J65_05565 [Duncaniella sp.]|nr:hypothetical protein [Duncaniella sp.]